MFPPIETALWTNAYKYHQEQRRVIKFKLDGINYQCVGCQNETANKAKADAFVSKTKSLEFENFIHFFIHFFPILKKKFIYFSDKFLLI